MPKYEIIDNVAYDIYLAIVRGVAERSDLNGQVSVNVMVEELVKEGVIAKAVDPLSKQLFLNKALDLAKESHHIKSMVKCWVTDTDARNNDLQAVIKQWEGTGAIERRPYAPGR